jgi:uncharacterized membrane protein (DUF4010 family)
MDDIGGALVASLLGLLVGLERERTRESPASHFAGIRTFPVLSLAGFLGALVSREGMPLALPAVLLAVGGLVAVSHLRTLDRDAGATTEATALVTPLIGALVALERAPLAAALAVVVALLLAEKTPLHRFAGAVSADEMLGVLKFGIVAAVLLPLLPATPMGPLGAIVPRHVGFVVLAICGVGLGGYVLVRLLGQAGWTLAGLVGGLVSSTAVTLSFSGRARSAPSLVRPLAGGILLASTVLYARTLVLLAIFDPPLAAYLVPRLLALIAVAVFFVLRVLGRREAGGRGRAEVGNPVELGRALALGLLFAAVLLVARLAQARFGTAGFWTASALGGLVDVDPVALAGADLRSKGVVSLPVAAGGFLLATLANLTVKGIMVLVAGGRALWRHVRPGFLGLGAVTLLLLGLAWGASE